MCEVYNKAQKNVEFSKTSLQHARMLNVQEPVHITKQCRNMLHNGIRNPERGW